MVYEIRIMKKITVIISAGDIDKYMEETLDSLSAQSIVNDIEIIDQTKPGQITRGDEVLNKAEGKYLYFMNSGDLLTSFALEELWNICETKHLDILLFSGAVFYENTKLAKRYKNLSDEFYRCGSYAQVITGKEMRNQLKKNKDILPPVSMQILKKDLLIGEKTDFHNRIDTDRCFVKRILLKAERVFCVNDIYLYKRITEPSGVGKMLQVLTTPGYLVKKIFRYMRKNGIKCTGIAIIRKLRAR